MNEQTKLDTLPTVEPPAEAENEALTGANVPSVETNEPPAEAVDGQTEESGEQVGKSDELSALRAALAEKEAALAEKEAALTAATASRERFEREFAAFRAEFPEVPLGQVSDEVWAEVGKGVPLAAAYALAERRAMKQAEKSHRATGAWHSLSGGTDEGLLSPSEVRAMTQREVRLNYDRILESMKRW